MASQDLAYLDIRQGTNSTPHKPVLLLTIMRAIELGMVSENKIRITDELIGLYRNYWKELVRSDHVPNFHLPFYHLSNDGANLWNIKKIIGFDNNVLSASNSPKGLGVLRQYVEYGELRPDIFIRWADPVQRELARAYILQKYFPIPVDEGELKDREAWTSKEIQPAIEAYFEILEKELADQKVVKAKVYRSLEDEGKRTAKSYEFKMQNISAVLALNDLPFLRGLLPAHNFQRVLEPQVMAYLDAHPAKRAQLLEYGQRRTIQTLFNELIEIGALLEEPAPQYVPQPTRERSYKGYKVDYAAKEHACRRLGRDGEELVVEHERYMLIKAGRPDLAKEVEQVSKTIGDGLGYDIRSFTADYEERHIEVKTTNFSKQTPFVLTENELAFSEENSESYRLYRLYEFAKKPRYFHLSGSLKEACVLVNSQYRAWAR